MYIKDCVHTVSGISATNAVFCFLAHRPDSTSRDDRINNATNELRRQLFTLNDQMAATIGGHLNSAVNNYIANGRWRFVDRNGDRLPRVDSEKPIMWK